MMHKQKRAPIFIFLGALAAAPLASASYLRVATYNIEADISGFTSPRPGMSTVLKGIGDETVNGIQRPLDILTLQETTSNTATVDPIVTQLNSIYGSGVYARSAFQATQFGSSSSGNGPNAIVYNTQTLQLIASVGVGTPLGSTNGEYRQVARYQFRPLGGTSSNDFYVYVSHAKAGTSSSDFTDRNHEAQIIRTDEATLPANSRIIYSGDFNTTSSSDASYTTLTASGIGQAFDPLNSPGTWDNNSSFRGIMTESATDLRFRDDFELLTQNVLSDSSGLMYLAGSYHTFGINGSTQVNGSVNSPSNTALAGLGASEQASVLSALTTASDHLPVVADYSINVPEPTAAAIVCAIGLLRLCRRR